MTDFGEQEPIEEIPPRKGVELVNSIDELKSVKSAAGKTLDGPYRRLGSVGLLKLRLHQIPPEGYEMFALPGETQLTIDMNGNLNRESSQRIIKQGLYAVGITVDNPHPNIGNTQVVIFHRNREWEVISEFRPIKFDEDGNELEKPYLIADSFKRSGEKIGKHDDSVLAAPLDQIPNLRVSIETNVDRGGDVS